MNDFLQTYASTIITVGAALGLLGAGARFIWHRAMQPFIEVQNAAADIIRAQLTPNHGSSLVDKVNKIEGNHQEAQRHWENLESVQGQLVKRLEKIEQATAEPKDVP
jgi:hypothetical protein